MTFLTVDIPAFPTDQTPDFSSIQEQKQGAKRIIKGLLNKYKNKESLCRIDFKIKLNKHDLGGYVSILGVCNEDDEEAVKLLFDIEDNFPDTWEDLEK